MNGATAPDAALRDQIKAALEAADCDHDDYREYFDVCDRCRADAVMPVVEAALTAARDETAAHDVECKRVWDEYPKVIAALREQTQRADDLAGQLQEARDAIAGERRGKLAAQAAVRRLRALIDSYPPGSRFARSGAQALFRATLDAEQSKQAPRRLTEQQGGIPNDAYTADDHPKGM